MFTEVGYWTLFCNIGLQFISIQPNAVTFAWNLFIHPHINLPNRFVPLKFSARIYYSYLIIIVRVIIRPPPHLTLHDIISLTTLLIINNIWTIHWNISVVHYMQKLTSVCLYTILLILRTIYIIFPLRVSKQVPSSGLTFLEPVCRPMLCTSLCKGNKDVKRVVELTEKKSWSLQYMSNRMLCMTGKLRRRKMIILWINVVH